MPRHANLHHESLREQRHHDGGPYVSPNGDDLLCYDGGRQGNSEDMITLGVVLMLLGLVLGIPILWTVGIILLVVGLVLMLMGRTGRQVGGRAHYW
jgi:hypothetical protein